MNGGARPVERDPHLPRLSREVLTADLATMYVGTRLLLLDETDSTNEVAAREAEAGGAAGLVVLAESQTAGRGRHGRRWSAVPRSGVLMSVVLDPPEELAQPAALVCLTAVSVAEALAEFTPLPVQIKWPNDVYIEGRKVGGILLERRRGVVIGIGVNVHDAPQLTDRTAPPAAALTEFAAAPPDRSAVARRIIEALDLRYAQILAGGLADLVRAWRSRLAFVNQPVELELAERRLRGTLLDIDPLHTCRIWTPTGQPLEIPVHEIRSLLPCQNDAASADTEPSTRL